MLRNTICYDVNTRVHLQSSASTLYTIKFMSAKQHFMSTLQLQKYNDFSLIEIPTCVCWAGKDKFLIHFRTVKIIEF